MLGGVKLKQGRFRVGRRHFLRLTTAGSAGVYFLGCDGSPSPADGGSSDSGIDGGLPTRMEQVRALVVGSGFGGSIAALRLAEAGIPSTILERGRRWDLTDSFDTFCTTQAPDRRCVWGHRNPILPGLPPVPLRGTPYVGLLQRVPGANIDAVCAAAVGGGSLVYSGIMIQPPRNHFESVMPAGVCAKIRP